MSTFDKQFAAENFAVRVFRDQIADFLLNHGHAVKISDITKEVGAAAGVSAKLIKFILNSDSSFTGAERRFNFKYRTDFNRPLDGDIKSILEGVGYPIDNEYLANELALLNTRNQEYFMELLPSFVETRADYFKIDEDHYGLAEWLLVTDDEDKDTVIDINFFDNYAEVQSELDKIVNIDISGDTLAEQAMSVLNKAGAANHKILSFALWNSLKSKFDSKELFKELWSDESFVFLSGQIWAKAADLKDTGSKLKKLSAAADKELVEEEEVIGDYQANRDDLAEINGYLFEKGTAERLTDIIANVLEYSADNPRFESIYNVLLGEMSTNRNYERVGIETFVLAEQVPESVSQVPDELLPEFVDSSLFDDPEADLELIDEGLEADLAELIHNPYYEDFGGEHEVEFSEEIADVKKTTMSLTYPHKIMGTLKLRQTDIPFFASDTSYAALTVKDSNDAIEPFKIWLNNEELIITNLNDWYDAMDVKVGSQVTFKKDGTTDSYIISLEPKVDTKIEIPEARINELTEMAETAGDENWSIYKIVTEILGSYKLGLNFYNIWSEVNVIRRTPKRVIASILSSYEGFTVTKAGNWKFDAKKLGQKRTDKDDFVM